MRIPFFNKMSLGSGTFFGRIPLAFIVLLSALGSAAHAGNWSMNGSSCVPGDPAIQGHAYTITGGSLTHQADSTALITLYCPVTETWNQLAPTILQMTYMDSDPTIAHITAQLIRLSAEDGSLTFVSKTLSNQSTPHNTGVKIGLSFSHTFDFKFSYYYVRVDITRTKTTAFAKLFGVSLDCEACTTAN